MTSESLNVFECLGRSLNVWGDIGYTLQNPAISASIPSLIPALGMHYFDIHMLSIPYMHGIRAFFYLQILNFNSHTGQL